MSSCKTTILLYIYMKWDIGGLTKVLEKHEPKVYEKLKSIEDFNIVLNNIHQPLQTQTTTFRQRYCSSIKVPETQLFNDLKLYQGGTSRFVSIIRIEKPKRLL